MTPPREPRPWNESNPEWWKVQVEDKGDLAWLWLVNEWAAREAEAGAPLREALEQYDPNRKPSDDADVSAEEWRAAYFVLADIAIRELEKARAALAATPAPEPLDVEALRLPWHRETIGHRSTAGIVASVAADLNVPLAEGVPPNTDATWIVNADNKVVAFVGNGPRQTDNADAIIAALAALAARAAATEATR